MTKYTYNTNKDNSSSSSSVVKLSPTVDVAKTATTMTATTKPRSRANMLKNVALLSGMWGLGLGAAFVQISSSMNLLTETNHQSISTMPLGLIMLLSSPCAILIPRLIRRYGEKKVFVFGASGLGCTGSILQMIGVWITTNNGGELELSLLMVGAAFQSFTYAATNNSRFAVAYFATPEFLTKATALVILGGIIGAIGPYISNYTRDMIPEKPYAGNYLQIAIMYFMFGVLAAMTDFDPPMSSSASNDKNHEDESNDKQMVSIEEGPVAIDKETEKEEGEEKERSLLDILRQTDLPFLILCQCLSYNIMGLYMNDIKLAMANAGYDADQTTNAITFHMLGMFVPSLFSGHVIGYCGTWPSTFVGFLILLLGEGLFLINDSLMIFNIGIIIIGVGWNISFVGPSAAVSKVHTPKEKSKVIGLNDGIMLLSIGAITLSAASIYTATGSNWIHFNAIMITLTAVSLIITSIKIFKSSAWHRCMRTQQK